jgi:hypothetical protein
MASAIGVTKADDAADNTNRKTDNWSTTACFEKMRERSGAECMLTVIYCDGFDTSIRHGIDKTETMVRGRLGCWGRTDRDRHVLGVQRRHNQLSGGPGEESKHEHGAYATGTTPTR